MGKVTRIGKRRKRDLQSSRSIDLPRAWYIVIPIVLLLVVFSPIRRTVENFFQPYLAIAGKAEKSLSDQSLLLHSKGALAREIARLREQNFNLSIQANAVRNLEKENRRLRALLSLDDSPEFDYLACDVILRDPWLWNDGFTINRGSKSGLQPGLAVLSVNPDYTGRPILIGVIESVAKNSSRVISVLNPEFRISVSLPESNAVGFLNAGQLASWGGGSAAIGFLPANRTFAINERLYTTGFEALIPRGLWLGYLDSIEPASLPFGNRLYRCGVMRPAGDFENLRTVMVARLAKASAGDTAQ